MKQTVQVWIPDEDRTEYFPSVYAAERQLGKGNFILVDRWPHTTSVNETQHKHYITDE